MFSEIIIISHSALNFWFSSLKNYQQCFMSVSKVMKLQHVSHAHDILPYFFITIRCMCYATEVVIVVFFVGLVVDVIYKMFWVCVTLTLLYHCVFLSLCSNLQNTLLLYCIRGLTVSKTSTSDQKTDLSNFVRFEYLPPPPLPPPVHGRPNSIAYKYMQNVRNAKSANICKMSETQNLRMSDFAFRKFLPDETLL